MNDRSLGTGLHRDRGCPRHRPCHCRAVFRQRRERGNLGYRWRCSRDYGARHRERDLRYCGRGKPRLDCVTPAAAGTDTFAQMTEAQIAYMLSKFPMGRFVLVEEIAALVAWLSSAECSFSTGGVFDISGG
jgi:Enoyl-(Acyl carrier protein) reductase